MRTAIWELQTAIVGRLTAADGLPGVFDGEPPADEEITLPYIIVGEETAAPDDTKTYYGEDMTKTLHVFSDYNGRKEAAQIMDLTLQALTETPLTLGGGFTLESIDRELLEVFREDTGLYHGVMRLRFKIKGG